MVADTTTTPAGGWSSLKVTSGSTSGLAVRHSYYIPVTGGASYNLGASLMASNADSGAVLRVYWFTDTAGNPANPSSTGDLSKLSGTTSTWLRKATQITAPSGANYAKVEVAVNGTGTAWFDNVQLESGSGRAGSNALVNPSFDYDNDQTGLADFWYPPNPNPGGIGIDGKNPHSGPASEKLIGASGVDKYVGQVVNLSGQGGTRIAFSGWARAEGGTAGVGNFAMHLYLKKNDGTTVAGPYKVTFDPANSNWQWNGTIVSAPAAFDYIKVYADYDNQTGTAWFDDFEVRKENPTSAVASAYNYQDNPSFEQDYDGTNWPDGWPTSKQGGTTATFTWSWFPYAYTGNRSVSIANPTGWASVYALRRVPFDSSKTYLAVGYIKAQDVSSSAVLILHAYDAAGNWLGEVDSQPISGTTDWTRVSIVVNASNAPAGTASLAVGVQMRAGSGTAYFDNIRLQLGEARTRFAYDTAGNYVTKVTDPLSNALNLGVNANTGNVTSATDPRGNQVTYGYDFLNRLTGVTYPYQASIGGPVVSKSYSYTYDANGNLTAVTDPGGRATNLGYNELGELTSTTETVSGVARTTSLAYDALGNLTRIDRPDGTFSQFGYDYANRLTGVSYGAGGTPTESFSYGYDPAGNLTSFGNGTNTFSLAYDALNRLASVTEPGGATPPSISYTYDPAGHRTQTTVTPGTFSWSLGYVYDARGRALQVVDNAQGKTNYYLYNESGQLIKSYQGNGTSAYYTHDAAGRVAGVRVESPGGWTQFWYTYGYDANGNRSRSPTSSLASRSPSPTTPRTSWSGRPPGPATR